MKGRARENTVVVMAKKHGANGYDAALRTKRAVKAAKMYYAGSGRARGVLFDPS